MKANWLSCAAARRCLQITLLLLAAGTSAGSGNAQDVGMNLSSQLKQELGDVANLRNITTQFLQGGGRWFPTPKGDDADLANYLRDLQERLGQFKQDWDTKESLETLKYDMRQVNESYDNVEATLPKVGGNKDVANDWNAVQRDMSGVRQTFDAVVANSDGSSGNKDESTPTVPDLIQKLGMETQGYKGSLGAFLNMPTRIPPNNNEDLMLVQSLKQFEQMLSKFAKETELGRPIQFLQEQMKQIRYVARKMDPYMEAIGPDDTTIQRWQQMRSTVEQLHELIGNKPEGSDAAYLEPIPSAQPAQSFPGIGPESGQPQPGKRFGSTGDGAPLPQDNLPGL